jgi:hypothetical protein
MSAGYGPRCRATARAITYTCSYAYAKTQARQRALIGARTDGLAAASPVTSSQHLACCADVGSSPGPLAGADRDRDQRGSNSRFAIPGVRRVALQQSQLTSVVIAEGAKAQNKRFVPPFSAATEVSADRMPGVQPHEERAYQRAAGPVATTWRSKQTLPDAYRVSSFGIRTGRPEGFVLTASAAAESPRDLHDGERIRTSTYPCSCGWWLSPVPTML